MRAADSMETVQYNTIKESNSRMGEKQSGNEKGSRVCMFSVWGQSQSYFGGLLDWVGQCVCVLRRWGKGFRCWIESKCPVPFATLNSWPALMPTPAPCLSVNPVQHDEGQAHHHERETQGGKAGGLQTRPTTEYKSYFWIQIVKLLILIDKYDM